MTTPDAVPAAPERNPPPPPGAGPPPADHRAAGLLVLAVCGGALAWTADVAAKADKKVATHAGANWPSPARIRPPVPMRAATTPS